MRENQAVNPFFHLYDSVVLLFFVFTVGEAFNMHYAVNFCMHL